MQDVILKICAKAQDIASVLKDEAGQDLIEYALVVALIAFAAVAGMSTLATGINTAFGNIATQLTTNIT